MEATHEEPEVSYGIKLGYVSLRVRLEDATFVHNLIKEVELDGRCIAPHDMHVTMMYDKSNPIPSLAVKAFGKPEVEYLATISGVGMLGEEGSKYRAVVLHLESTELQNRFDELSIFMSHSFDDFMAHTSVVYGATEQDYEKVDNLLTSLVGTSIVLYGESFATVKEN